jgi:hypothetical protein
MKTGKTLGELAAEIERQANTKRDFVASTNVMEVRASDQGPVVELKDKGAFAIGDIAHNQIAAHTGIPQKYADKMRAETPELYANNVNTWFRKNPAVRMTRMLDGGMRAFLSDKFQPFDNFDFGSAALPILAQRKLNVMSCEITDKRLYIKAVDEQLYRDVPVGFKMGDGSHNIFDTCAPVVILSNSEVGFGRLVIETGVYTQACTNLALFAKGGMKRTHVGARHALTDNMDVSDLDAVLSSAAKRKTMEAVWLQARDVIAAAFDPAMIDKRVEQLAAAAGAKLPAENVDKVLEVVQERYNLNEGERNSIFKHLLEGGQLNQYGLHAAITRSAQDADDYDRATELEYLGGKVVELNRNEWQQLAAA